MSKFSRQPHPATRRLVRQAIRLIFEASGLAAIFAWVGVFIWALDALIN
jgi:hypothetical protein